MLKLLQQTNEKLSDEKIVVKRNMKDCVFTDLFGNKKYLRELYLALHPEDTDVTEEDLTDITIENVLVNALYNDLGFRVGNKLIVLVEARSSWSPNILIRAFLYLATTYQNYIDEKSLDLYASKKIEIPKPELYVIYTGNRKDRPKELWLSKEYFPNNPNLALDVKVKMIYGDKEDDIIGQYVLFTKVYDEQRKIYGRTKKAIVETIRICKQRNILKEYLESREKEVVTMMITLFDNEQIMKNHDATIRREATEKAIINIITVYKEVNGTREDAIRSIVTMYEYSLQDATAIVEKYWNEVPLTIDLELSEEE